jgi:HSP20 family protein
MSPAVRPATVVQEVTVMVARFDPFRDFDRLTEGLLSHAAEAGQAMRAMPIDLFRSGDHYVLLCDLPGMDPGSIDVGVDGRSLTIRAQRSPRGDDVEWLIRERPTGTFARQLTLGNGVMIDGIQASYTDGVLAVTLPVAEQARPRKIEVARPAQATAMPSTAEAPATAQSPGSSESGGTATGG